MPRHTYIVVSCKTPRCSGICAVKYLGVIKGRRKEEKVVAAGFRYACGLCNKSHWYEPEECRIEMFDFAPPPGWKDGCMQKAFCDKVC